ncbi:hypothetical protein ACFLR7_03675 [Acidobacteriota bacterium]
MHNDTVEKWVRDFVSDYSDQRGDSLVTDLDLEPSARPERESCLHKAGKECLKCSALVPCSVINPNRQSDL